MAESFDGMLPLIQELTRTLAELTEVQKNVVAAVRSDDLAALGECMKKENVLSLALRNQDRKRVALQQALGIEQIKLSQLPGYAPDEKTQQAVRQAAEQLTAQYQMMQAAAEVARSALECGLHEGEGMMTRMGLDPKQTEIHSASTSGAHTDFHA